MTMCKCVVINLCLLIYMEKVFGQTPGISMNYDTLRAKSELLCFNLTTGTMRFYENGKAVVDVWYNNAVCNTKPDTLPKKLVCDCKDKNTAVCTISLEFYQRECQIWQCGHIHHGFIGYSEPVNVCGHVRTSSVTNTERNYSSLSATRALGYADESMTVNPKNIVSTSSVTNTERNYSSLPATRALGYDDESITVNPKNIDPQKEGSPSVPILVIYVVSGVVTLALMTLGVQRLYTGGRCLRPHHTSEIFSLPVESVNISYPEQMGLDIQTTNVIPARPTDSVHLYESIPPSPIADISFSNFAEDTEFVEEIHIADAGFYQSLDQNTLGESTYNVTLQEPNVCEETLYINLKL